MKILISFYVILLLVLTIYSYGFVDPNLVLSTDPIYKTFSGLLFELVFYKRNLSTIIFVSIIILFFIYYFIFLRLIKKEKLNRKTFLLLIGLTVAILLFSYPAFSYDIFNYIFTAKVTYLYKENPYLVMPIEILGEPNLAFTRAANKIALYGPSWIGLTFVPHILGFGSILLTIFSFKLFVAAFYLGAVWVVWKISKNLLSVALFALNPLVVIETLISSHNDIVMMFFAVFAFYLLKLKKSFLAFSSLVASIFIKYATIVLVPLFLVSAYLILKSKKFSWDKIYAFGALLMFAVFLSAPLREEIYPWYVIWMLILAVLVPKNKILVSLLIALSFGVLLRYVPVLFTGSYFGLTPIIKEILTILPVAFVGMFWLWKVHLSKKLS